MDRLSIINDALLATGNDTLNSEYDGSQAWLAAESAYRRAVGFLLARHNWNFATTTVGLAGLLPSSPSKRFSYAYQLPSDLLHLSTAFYQTVPLTDYEIINNSLCCNYDTDVTLKYVRAPQVSAWPLSFAELVTIKTEEGILRGLNEDGDRADGRLRVAETLLGEVRAQTDQQEPAQAVLRSRTAERRLGMRRVSPLHRHPYGGVP
jgi:hypothetical protein